MLIRMCITCEPITTIMLNRNGTPKGQGITYRKGYNI
jgi:hypothetical protein